MSSRPVAARDSNRVHRGFGAGVAEAHLLALEPLAEHLGELDGRGGRSREVGSGSCGARDGLGHLRMRMADEHAAEAVVEIDVLVVVDVEDPAALSLADVEGVRVADLERRTDSERQVVQRALVQPLRSGGAVEKQAAFACGDLTGAHGDRVDGGGHIAFSSSWFSWCLSA